ncbi:MAG: MFS transporter, partial [Candidatus Eiseniibacteriota bacterium]
EDARVCKEISDEACRYVPRNFFRILVTQTLTSLGDLLASPKTVLTWLLAYVGAPLYLIAFVVPIRESGSMVPQLVIASYVRRLPRRKGVWVVGAMLQCAAVATMGLAAMFTGGVTAGWAIIGCLVVFSLSRGLCSVASKDVMGKTIPKTRRGRLGGIASSLSGLAAIVLGLVMLLRSAGGAGGAAGAAAGGGAGTAATGGPAGDAGFYGLLLVAAGALWLLAALVYARVEEFAGETGGGGNALAEAVRRLDLLRTDGPFRHFVVTRALLLCSALSAPYYVVLAQRQHGTSLALLGAFIVAGGLASSLSATVWGVMADASSKRVLVIAATMACVLGFAVFVIDGHVESLRAARWTYPAAFFVLSIAHSGVRIGRKTYIVDMAGGNRRTDYVAVSNTVIGIVLLATGAFGALATFLSPAAMILVLSAFGAAGALSGTALPDAEA